MSTDNAYAFWSCKCYIYIHMFWFQVLPVRGYPPHGIGLTMERRAHPLCHVGNGFMRSTLHGRSGDHARDIVITTHAMHHTSHITPFSIHHVLS